MKKRVAELIGVELDYCAAIAAGHKAEIVGERFNPDDEFCSVAQFYGLPERLVGMPFAPSTEWSQGGPIIEQEGISIHKNPPDVFRSDLKRWTADTYRNAPMAHELGSTPLIAAMRAFVASKFGEEVEVPDA
jgi:hypothetical protein